MNSKRYVEKTDIKKWKNHGLSFLGVGIINAAMGAIALVMDNVPSKAKPILLFLISGTALLLFSVAFVVGIWILIRYYRYTLYFKTTGLTRCTEDNVMRWLETHDVTQ
ncbi:MAG: hypothetical protein IKG01_03500 [Lachnospiraceae bacterium]|nr:hypothetical protein [Lachnospiraceae bacterium]